MQISISKNAAAFKHLTIQQYWWIALFVTSVIKLFIATQLPLLGEEAYNFNMTNHHFLYGYYDHPGMVVVMAYLAQLVSYKTLWLRLPQLLFTTLIALSPLLWRKRFGLEKCLLTSMILLWSPMNVLFVLIVNDSFLLFFSVATMIAMVFATERGHWWWYMLAGVCLGAAFFSKYLAFPTAISVFFCIALSDHFGWQKKLARLSVLFLGFCPFLLVNLFWNYQHSWDNLFMNLHSRVGDHHVSILAFFAFIGFCILLLTPFNLKAMATIARQKFSIGTPFDIVRYMFIVHALFFIMLFVSGSKGIHWLFPGYVATVLLFLGLLSVSQLWSVVKGTALFVSVISLVFMVGLSMPLHWVKPFVHKYSGLAFYMNADKMSDALDEFRQHYTIMAPSYSRASVLGVGKSYVPVWGIGSHKGYARETDILFDFKSLQGKNIAIVNLSPPKLAEYQPYFDHIASQKVVAGDAVVYLLLGRGFHYSAYRDTVLRNIYDNYYQFKFRYLPYGQDYFRQKYFS